MHSKEALARQFVLPHQISTKECAKRNSLPQRNSLNICTILFGAIFIFPADAISVEECCRQEGVPDICVSTMCNPGIPPSDFAVYDIFERRNNCSRHLSPIAKCLAAGRDNFSCCSKEAKDSDLNACFGLCRGDGGIHTSSSYQTCIAINLGSMFICFEKGYRKSPSQPENVSIEEVGTTEVELHWNEPKYNAPLVDHYLILIYELEVGTEKPDPETELRVETISRKTRITLLEPGTRYLLHIIAVGASDENSVSGALENDGDLNYPRSLPSKIHFKTAGIAPQVKPFKEMVRAALNSNTVVACRIRISGSPTRSVPEIRWEYKRGIGGHFHPVRINDRLVQGHYNFSKFRPRELLATLQIKGVKMLDEGFYKCKVFDDFGSADSTVELSPSDEYQAMEVPPETPLECCNRLGVEQRCRSMCGSSEVEQKMKYVPRPFMNQNCSSEIAKVLSCSMPNVDDSACCISKKLPSQCLYLCDHQLRPSNLMPLICLDYVNAAEECRFKSVQNRPGRIANLRVNKSADGTNSHQVRFEPSERAESHVLYWRHQNGTWQHRRLGPADAVGGAGSSLSTRLSGPLDQVVLVAVNPFGISQSARMKVRDGKWAKV